MRLDIGRYRGTALTEIPTEYLEWAVGHVAMSDEMERAVVAEYARRANAKRVAAWTPARHLWSRVSGALTRFAARHGW